MVINCVIKLDNNDGRIFYSGQTISGTVELNLNEKSNLTGLRLLIQGYAECNWIECKAAPKCSLHVVPFSGRENYLSVVNYLVGSSDGIKNIELPVGIHKFSFSCSLSSHLPSSIETTKGFIRYSLEVSIDVPLGFKKEFKFPFTVIKPEDMNALPSALKKPLEVEVYKRFCSWKCISNPLKFIVKIPYSGFVPGEAVNVIVDVKNDSNNDVRKFKISLLKTIKYTSQTPKVKTKIVKETVMNVFENGIKRGTSGRIRKGFVISHVPSTNITYCTVIEISYELKIVGKISGLHFSPKVKIPIMIGTIPIVDHLILKKDTKTVATDPPSIDKLEKLSALKNHKGSKNVSQEKFSQQVVWNVPSITSISTKKDPEPV